MFWVHLCFIFILAQFFVFWGPRWLSTISNPMRTREIAVNYVYYRPKAKLSPLTNHTSTINVMSQSAYEEITCN